MSFLPAFLICLAGAFVCNCIPHIVAGLLGQQFPTPFAKPRGVGNSPPLLNFLWGCFNLAAGLSLIEHGLALNASPGPLLFMAGFMPMGIYLSLHFGKVRAYRSAPPIAED